MSEVTMTIKEYIIANEIKMLEYEYATCHDEERRLEILEEIDKLKSGIIEITGDIECLSMIITTVTYINDDEYGFGMEFNYGEVNYFPDTKFGKYIRKNDI